MTEQEATRTEAGRPKPFCMQPVGPCRLPLGHDGPHEREAASAAPHATLQSMVAAPEVRADVSPHPSDPPEYNALAAEYGPTPPGEER